MSVANNVKSDFWEMHVTTDRIIKVVFLEPVTAKEAQEALISEDYEDIIDEEDCGIQKITDNIPLNPINVN